MGTVYLVINLDQGRCEAIKLLRPVEYMEATEANSRFRREARAIQRLRHPNIIELYDFGRLADDQFYLAMEYVEGCELSRLCDGRPIETDRAARLMVQLASAIDHAHEQGVVHRDIKPRNILVTAQEGEERIKVLDFGVAKIVDPLYTDSIMSGKDVGFLGTPGFIAPEIFTGVNDDPRSDIYAFGCIAFQLLTGRPPFEGRGMAVCEAHLHARPPSPRALNPRGAISEALESVVLHCLEKKPQDRFQTGREIVAALGHDPRGLCSGTSS